MAACIGDSICKSTLRLCSSDTEMCRAARFCRLSSFNFASCSKTTNSVPRDEHQEDDIWLRIREEASLDVKEEPVLSNYYNSLILSRDSLESAVANHLAIKLSNPNMSLSRETLYEIFFRVFTQDQELRRAIREDLKAARERDPACVSYLHCLLHFKGFQAIQAHRASHKLWLEGNKAASLMIQSRVSETFAVDIHPGAKIGRGMLLDHATGVVIGETAVVGDNVTMLHGVTLGGRGESAGDRHPKIGDGVLLGVGSKVLGNVRVGDGAKVGAASVVLKEVPPFTTAVGNPARLIR